VNCVICRQRKCAVGVLCERCSEELVEGVMISPEQIESTFAGATPAALVDMWGHPHHLDVTTTIGRAAASGMSIVEPSVSRAHAQLARTERWIVRDLASTVGTFVNDRAIAGEHELHDRDRVRFGEVAFYFLADAPRLPPRPQGNIPTHQLPPTPLPRQLTNRAVMPFELHAPSGGGGGFVVIAGKQVQLTTPQYELVEQLVHAMLADVARPDDVRGFVPASALFKLSLESSDPSEDHVRQLVRRVRRLLAKAELGDLIEVRRGVGYRLHVMPRLDSN
jgi:hypothetical protein